MTELEGVNDYPDLSNRIRNLWKTALRQLGTDPWENLFLEVEPNTASRLRYNALKKTWLEDEIKIKIERESFNSGAMRKCFRAKKLGNFSGHTEWNYASNVVLKQYKDEVDSSVLFEDIELQMKAKLFSEHYNKRNPPKKIDIMQICIIRVKDYEENLKETFFQMEHYIEGNYVKFNSNSGFVSDDCRRTPQAFSHFSFEQSHREEMIVDIQGVNDLWTDPQIHSANGLDYGDGNLGIRGMAMFLLSHKCNNICAYLNLPEFELHESEKSGLLRNEIETTMAGLTKIETDKRRARNPSDSSFDSGFYSLPLSSIRENCRSISKCTTDSDFAQLSSLSESNTADHVHRGVTKEDVMTEIHYVTCQLYCQERIPFSNDASAFHLEISANSGHLEAQSILAKKFLGIPTDVLEEIQIEENIEKGFHFLSMASERGDSQCCYLLARYYHSGIGLPPSHEINFKAALALYQKLITDGIEIGVPSYTLIEYQADIYMAGGLGVERQPERAAELYEEAAELATMKMKGKIAAKFFEKAELAWAEVE